MCTSEGDHLAHPRRTKKLFTRTFGGKRFSLDNHTTTKARAKFLANQQRKVGHRARVVKNPLGYGVWVRKG